MCRSIWSRGRFRQPLVNYSIFGEHGFALLRYCTSGVIRHHADAQTSCLLVSVTSRSDLVLDSNRLQGTLPDSISYLSQLSYVLCNSVSLVLCHECVTSRVCYVVGVRA